MERNTVKNISKHGVAAVLGASLVLGLGATAAAAAPKHLGGVKSGTAYGRTWAGAPKHLSAAQAPKHL